jgi:hypothetical protein
MMINCNFTANIEGLKNCIILEGANVEEHLIASLGWGPKKEERKDLPVI